MLELVAAVGEGLVIGKGGAMPWHLPEDLRRFRALTMGHAVIMGRRTHDAIGHPLDGRRNLVLTRHPWGLGGGVEPVVSVQGALQAAGSGTTYVIGGEEAYRAFLPIASALELTRVEMSVEGGDAFFPDWRGMPFRCVCRERMATASGVHVTYERWVRLK